MYLISLASCFFILSLSHTFVHGAHGSNVHNANHVFNAIHSSMRQWGSSLNHNGMSFFLATVPAGVSLYHGTGTPDLITGMEWLAFEPEHALVFARPAFGPHDPPPHGQDHDAQKPLSGTAPADPEKYGHLHTYTTRHPLHLMYVDGMSAGKTCNGTQDTQDTLLLNATDPCPGVQSDWERAKELCDLVKTTWAGKIDGIVRMEAGFEIILCEFEAHLDRTQAIAVQPQTREISCCLGGWQFIKAITSRYHGIGGDRVEIDYDHFVSAFAYPEIEDLFANDVQSDYPMPRLQNKTDEQLRRVREDVTNMIMSKHWTGDNKARNWQAVADMVVARYSGILHRLHTDNSLRSNSTILQVYLSQTVRPFIDPQARDATLETARCVANVLPSVPTPDSPLAHRTIFTIANRICTTLLSAQSLLSSSTPHSSHSSANHLSHAIDILDDLYVYLAWTIWKQCGTCQDDEVCWLPMWPMGSHEDHASPKCLDEEAVSGRMGYWGGLHGRPPKGGRLGGRLVMRGRRKEDRSLVMRK